MSIDEVAPIFEESSQFFYDRKLQKRIMKKFFQIPGPRGKLEIFFKSQEHEEI